LRLTATDPGGAVIQVGTIDEGGFIGQTTLTRQAVLGDAYAITEVTMVEIPRHCVEDLVQRKPLLLHEIGRAIEDRRSNLKQALADARD
jgi:CRP-like cAMP-binding protein